MPLFGLRTNKKNEQGQVQASAQSAKSAVAKNPKLSREKAPAKAVVENKKHIAMPAGTFSGASDAIIRPHITEKTGILSQNGVYTFVVARSANKNSVADAIRSLYKVTPVKVAVTYLPAKKVFVRGKIGRVSGMKKAVVTVKKGEKIDFV